MKKKAACFLMMMIMALSVCTVHAEDVLDLTGYWTTEIIDGTGMLALIDGDEVMVVWDIDDELYVYWVGSYIAPEENTNEYTWTSVRDAELTDMEWFASTEDTKDFHYKDGEISIEASAFGSSGTVYFYPAESVIADEEEAEPAVSEEIGTGSDFEEQTPVNNDERTVTNDYDESTNQMISIIGGLTFEVPSSWISSNNNTDELMYFYCTNGMLMVQISEYEVDILEEGNSADFIEGVQTGMENITDFTSGTLHLDGCDKDVLFCECFCTISDTDVEYYSAAGSFEDINLNVAFAFCDYMDSDLDHSNDFYSILNSISYDESSNTEENSADSDFEGQTLVDNGECTIIVTGIDEENSWGYTLDVYLENKSDDITYMFAISDGSVNGLAKDPFFAADVAPGKKSNEGITFSSLDDYGIDKVTDVALHFRVYDEDDWSADAIVDETFHIYPFGEENAIKFEREPQETDIVLVDTGDIKMTVTEFEEDDIWGYTADVFLENNTDANVMFSVDDASVNGYMLDPFWATLVPAGDCAYSSITWSYSNLEENNIDPSDISEIELILRIYNYDDWMAENFVSETVTINP